NVLIRRSKEQGKAFIRPEDVNVYEIYEGSAGQLKNAIQKGTAPVLTGNEITPV
ncbi:hypothetical protein EVA_03829, partial [gut metagenome]